MEYRITHKVGVKILSERQLDNIMPTYENLFHKIDVCRKVALEEKHREINTSRKRHYQYNFMYDNVFSILGKRGTGKTSVALTLRTLIEDRYKNDHDIVLPLIIPEIIPEDCSILGWLLAIVREAMEELEEKISAGERDSKNSEYWRRCKYVEGEKYEKSLTNQLDELCQMFYAKGYNPGNDTSYYRAIENSSKQSDDYYKFARKIAELWDSWVERIQYCAGLEKGQNKYAQQEGKSSVPLIYFIFDDVDLAPEKIEELLSVIIKYLSHPNIIVITTADEELFLEVIENRLDKNIGRYPRDLRNYLTSNQGNKYILWGRPRENEKEETKDDLVSQTARMYLGKVLPTSTRYYLRLFNTALEKEVFCLEDNKNLGQGIRAEIIRLMNGPEDENESRKDKKSKANEEAEENTETFLGNNERIINFYLKFIGNTSRQIGNVYIAIQDLINNLLQIAKKGKEKDAVREKLLIQIYQSCRYFLFVAINANHTLSNEIEHVDVFVDELFLQEYNQWKMFCNYAFLTDFLNEKMKNKNKTVQVDMGLRFFSLIAFVENILLIMEQLLPDGITNRKKIHVVVPMIQYIENIAFEKRAVFRNDLDPLTFFKHYVNLLDRLEVIVDGDMLDARFNMEYFYGFRFYNEICNPGDVEEMYLNNRKWFHQLAGMLSMVYGNIYLISQKNIEECLIYSNRAYLIRYQKRIDTEIKTNIKQRVMIVYMQQAWKIWQDLYKDNYGFGRKGKDEHTTFVMDIHAELSSNGTEDVYLRQIMDAVFSRIILFNRSSLKKFFAVCSVEIKKEIEANWKAVIEQTDMTRKLMVKYIEKISRVSFGSGVFLHDVPNAIEVLNNCEEHFVSYAASINEIVKRISAIIKAQDDKVSAVIDGTTAMELRNVLMGVHQKIVEQSRGNGYVEDEKMLLKEQIEELFAGMDVVLSPSETPSEEFQNAVNLGLWVVFVKILQVIYIFQTVRDEYENANSMSSKELEYIMLNGESVDTYYFQVYKSMVNIIGTEIGDVWDSATVGTENLVKDLRSTCRLVREQYVDSLIERIENE